MHLYSRPESYVNRFIRFVSHVITSLLEYCPILSVQVRLFKYYETLYFCRFLTQNGWFLIQTWLTDALQTRNTPLLLEILQLLQQCPISESRLKDNNVSQMIQSIAQEYNDASKS